MSEDEVIYTSPEEHKCTWVITFYDGNRYHVAKVDAASVTEIRRSLMTVSEGDFEIVSLVPLMHARELPVILPLDEREVKIGEMDIANIWAPSGIKGL